MTRHTRDALIKIYAALLRHGWDEATDAMTDDASPEDRADQQGKE